jgi:acetyl-CoA acetyltransferase
LADLAQIVKAPTTVEDLLNSRMIVAYPFGLLQCCLVTDGGGALILVAADRAHDFAHKSQDTCAAQMRTRSSGRCRQG